LINVFDKNSLCIRRIDIDLNIIQFFFNHLPIVIDQLRLINVFELQ